MNALVPIGRSVVLLGSRALVPWPDRKITTVSPGADRSIRPFNSARIAATLA